MSIGNLIRKNDKFDKEYIAEVMSNNDPMKRGRLQIKIPALMGDIPFWVNSTLVTGTVNFLMIPDTGDKVNVKFRNKDIYSGEWSLTGSPTNSANIDPNKYGMTDANGNTIIVDKTTNAITIESKATVTIKGTTITLDGDVIITGTITAQKTASIAGATSIGTTASDGLTVAGKVVADDAAFTKGRTMTSAGTVKAVAGIVKT